MPAGVGEARRFVQSGGAGLFVAHFGDVPFVVGEGRVGAVRVFGDETQHLRAEVGPQSMSKRRWSSVSSRAEQRKRRSRTSDEVQTAQEQPIWGTPDEVPVPRK